MLTAQVLRDIGRLGLGGLVIDRTATLLKGIAAARSAPTVTRALAGLQEIADDVDARLADPATGVLHFRATLEASLRAHQVALLLNAAEAP